MGTHAILNVKVPIRGMTAADLSDRLGANDQDKNTLVQFVRNMMDTAVFRDGGGIVARAEGVTTSVAYGEFSVVRADVTTGDKIIVQLPNGETVALTAVASSPTASNGEWTRGATNTTSAESIVAAINAYGPTKRWMTATNTTGTVKITAREDSTISNSIKLKESVTTSTATSLTTTFQALGSLSNGVTARSTIPTKTITVTLGALPTANDTLRFGNVLLTWKASATNENEVAIGSDEAESAANLETKINAHSILGKLVTATTDTATVTLTSAYNDMLMYLLYCVAAGTTPGTISGQFQDSAAVPTLSGQAVAFGVP
jgi:hypothetical protein